MKEKVGFELLRFYIAGGFIGVLGFLILYILKEYLGLWYLLASVLTDIFVYTLGFFIKKFWVFKNKDVEKTPKQFLLFIIVTVSFLIVDAGFMCIFVEYLHLQYIVAKGILALILSIVSYVINKNITFAK